MKNITKIVAGAATVASLWYYASLPAFAIDLCPPVSPTGKPLPGCQGIDIARIVGSIIGILFFVSFLIALVFLVIGGIRWILSGGDKEATNNAKSTVTSALVGLVIVIGSYILINVALKLLLGVDLGNLTIPVLVPK